MLLSLFTSDPTFCLGCLWENCLCSRNGRYSSQLFTKGFSGFAFYLSKLFIGSLFFFMNAPPSFSKYFFLAVFCFFSLTSRFSVSAEPLLFCVSLGFLPLHTRPTELSLRCCDSSFAPCTDCWGTLCIWLCYYMVLMLWMSVPLTLCFLLFGYS